MAITRRKRPDQTTLITWPKLPQEPPKDWPHGLYRFLSDLMRTIEQQPSVIIGVQKNGTDVPIRAKLNFLTATIADDQANDATKITT